MIKTVCVCDRCGQMTEDPVVVTFAAMDIRNPRPNYWFVFYLCDTGTFWLINSMDVVRLASRNSD